MLNSIARYAALAALALHAMHGSAASGGDWKPTKAVEYVVPAGPGAALDTAARVVKQALEAQKAVAQPIVVVNKVGGGGAVMASYLDEHPGDGNILATIAPTLLTSNIAGMVKKNYSDFTPLAVLFDEYAVLAVRADSPLKNVAGLIEKMKRGAVMTVGVAAAVGNHVHISIALPVKAAGINLDQLHAVGYKSSMESLAGLMSGDLDMVACTTSNAIALKQGGKIRLLAISSPRRLGGVLADVPTWKEQGINAELVAAQGVMGPRGLTPAQVRYWEHALRSIQDSPEYRTLLERHYWTPNFLGPAEARKYYDEQYRTWKAVLTDLGMAKQ
jgi:putative tricarboxylic transport membrane protein